MEKLDLRKQYKFLYNPSAKKIEVVDVPPLQYAMIDGVIPPEQGPGDSADFHEAVEALYGISYTLKFMFKKRLDNPVDYPVMWLEGLWAAASGIYDPAVRDTWLYTVMIMQPEFVTPDLFEEARAQLSKKKPGPGPARLRLEMFHEGPSMQVMHIGPYATEPETLARMDAFYAEHGYTFHGRHHEIYLSDPFKTAPEKMRTILRHPVRGK
ncbi:MAG: GyrI-like domain-containing protein [Candidatus Promineofilum sp.]|nr:GyrI-like domain-containing protein [Promineifilum sp.]